MYPSVVRRVQFVCVWVWLASAGIRLHAQPDGGRIAGTVVDPSNRVLPGVTVTLQADDTQSTPNGSLPRVVGTATTDGRGEFTFGGLTGGSYALVPELAGYQPLGPTRVSVENGTTRTVRIALALAPVSEVVTVVGSTGAGVPIESEDIEAELLQVFQLPNDRFQEALPLLPGVIRDPRGRISFNGTRPSQSALLVNGTNATDPVTGQFAFELPLNVVETVEVHAIPYSAEFGHVSGSVTNVRTLAGDDTWRTEFGSLIPYPRFRDGTMKGIDRATPRVKISGPLRRGRLWLSQAFGYRFARSQVKEEIEGEDEEIIEGFDAFTQVDVKLGDRHTLTGTLSFFPTNIDNAGIDSLHPAPASPDTHSGGWNVAVADEIATGPRTVWQATAAVRGYEVEVMPHGLGPSQLTPDGLFDNYFNTINRESRQYELTVGRLQSFQRDAQQHLVKIGGQLLATSFTGTDRSGPIEVRGADGHLLRRITFEGHGELDSSDLVPSAYIQDHWTVGPKLAFDLGLRYDYDAMLPEHHFSPRAAFSISVDSAGQTLVKGGWGLFFDQVFLHVDAFEQFQERVEQDFVGNSDTPSGPPLVFQNRRQAVLEEPTSRVWNVEFDHEVNDSLLVRVNYRENRAHGRLIVERVVDAADAALVLSSGGTLIGREFDATARWTFGSHGQLFTSFSKMRTSGDVNDFGEVYDNLRTPLVLENEETFQPFEVPNRILVWGLLSLAHGFTVTPGIEWRTGFPYTVYAEDYAPIGARNGERLPSFFSADVAVTKRIRLMGRQMDLGIQVYNLTGNDNPREIVSNVASPHFGELRNSVDQSFSVKLGIGL